jgi:hypothetical protein
MSVNWDRLGKVSSLLGDHLTYGRHWITGHWKEYISTLYPIKVVNMKAKVTLILRRQTTNEMIYISQNEGCWISLDSKHRMFTIE